MNNKQIKATPNSPLASIFFVFGMLHIYGLIKAKKNNYFQIIKIFLRTLNPILTPISMGFCLSFILIEALELLH